MWDRSSNTCQRHREAPWFPSGSALLPGPRFLATRPRAPCSSSPQLCSWWGSLAILFMPKSSGCPLLTHPWLLRTPATSLLWPGGPQATTSPDLEAASSL